MRIGKMLLAAFLATLSCAGLSFNAAADGSADAVAIRYHFAGTTELVANTNFDRARKILFVPPGKHFEDLVLDRLAGVYWNALQFDSGGDATTLLRPMLDELLQAESMGSFGGQDKNRLDFVLAARLDAKSADAWQKRLETVLHGQGEALTAGGYSGRIWSRPGNNSIWILRARDWIVAGRGEELVGVRSEYLQNIKQDDRPGPVMNDSWLSAEVDWPMLATWAPLAKCPLQLARTIIDVTASGGRMHATAYVSYPQAMPWQPQPWRIPKGLVNSPLSSFTASRDLAAFLKPDETLNRLSSHPFTNQLFCWALRAMPLQSYAAWPATDATNTLRKLGAAAPAILNPILAARNHTQLAWTPKDNRLSWLRLQLTAPTLEAAHDPSGNFLLAKLFGLDSDYVRAPDQLWSQFEQREDLVYFDWELTGMRLRQWHLLTELLPVLPPPTPQDVARREKAAKDAKLSLLGDQKLTPLAVTEAWLAEIGSPVLENTVTEVTRTSPTELTIIRNSQFLFTGLELVLLSHWLADAPVGPVDFNLLPRAKVSGPGLPPARK
ncbi:MAG TPA: hypothetical protein VK731_06030 [Candidatus Cybelea sp.]|nr:hypothetical protein [Candidatus Cybelea sp.]